MSRRTVAAFVAGALTGAAVSAGAALPFDRLETFAHALSLIERYYVDERDADALLYDAIGGLTQGLDDHSVFLEPEAYRAMMEQTTGEYHGVGVEVRLVDGEAVIQAVVPRSPADLQGVRAGDVIVRVDGFDVTELGLDAALDRIRGRLGTVVLLGLRRGEHRLDLAVERDRVRTASVTSRRVGSVGVVRIERFQRDTGAEVKSALGDLRSEPLAGIVLDLRGDPGGYFSQAVAVADLFLESGRIVSTLDRGPSAQIEVARREGTDARTPLVVLIDGDSASAAEIVAGALQDHGRAVLIGTTTYGKGSVQQFFELADGSALKLTTSRYFTPSGRSIHGSGIDPDFMLAPRGAEAPTLPLDELWTAPAPEGVQDDPTLRVALRYLDDPDGTRRWFEAHRVAP